MILRLLEERGRVLVEHLADEFAVSATTIRNDLNELAREGLVVRAHGGAIRSGLAALDKALLEKQKLHPEQKAAIARKAASMVQDGQTIILDAGSTTAELARALKSKRNLTVITHALHIAWELCDAPGIEVILTGGTLRQSARSMVGPLAEATLQRLTAEIAFIGVDGIDPEFGFTTPVLAEASLNQQMIRISREVVVVADSSKFGQRSLAVVCKPRDVKKVITDSGVSPEHRRALELLGVEVLLA